MTKNYKYYFYKKACDYFGKVEKSGFFFYFGYK